MSQIKMNKSSSVLRVVSPAALIAVTGLCAPAMADFNYADFSTTPNLQFNGVATPFQNALSVTPPVARSAGSVWHTNMQGVTAGFTTDFTFRVRDKSGVGSDGFAFVIQNSFNQSIGGAGGGGGNTGIFALGAGGGALGYASNLAFPAAGVGINNSLAIEFDLFNNQTDWDDFNSSNHISVHSMGALANQPNASTALAHITSTGSDFWNDMGDGQFYDVRVVYTPGIMSFFMKPSASATFGSALMNINVNLATQLSLPTDINNIGSAFVGFTAGTGGAANVERHEITRWSFTSNPIPTPGAAGMLAAAGLCVARRRRR